MPTATKFSALGRGNGFPFCFVDQHPVLGTLDYRTDVSQYDNWITLGGTAKGNSPTDAQKTLSFINAVKLWFNLYSVTGSMSADVTDGGPVSYTGKEVILKRSNESIALQPIRRSCFGTNANVNQQLNTLSSSFQDDNGSEDNVASVNLAIGFPRFLVKMYDGSVNNESNFVGFGVTRMISLYAGSGGSFGSSEASVTIDVASFVNGTNDSGFDPSNTVEFEQKVYQSDIGGIPFRSKTRCTSGNPGGGGTPTRNLSAAELSGTAGVVVTTSGDPPVTYFSDASASISSIDFWTY